MLGRKSFLSPFPASLQPRSYFPSRLKLGGTRNFVGKMATAKAGSPRDLLKTCIFLLRSKI